MPSLRWISNGGEYEGLYMEVRLQEYPTAGLQPWATFVEFSPLNLLMQKHDAPLILFMLMMALGRLHGELPLLD